MVSILLPTYGFRAKYLDGCSCSEHLMIDDPDWRDYEGDIKNNAKISMDNDGHGLNVDIDAFDTWSLSMPQATDFVNVGGYNHGLWFHIPNRPALKQDETKSDDIYN